MVDDKACWALFFQLGYSIRLIRHALRASRPTRAGISIDDELAEIEHAVGSLKERAETERETAVVTTLKAKAEDHVSGVRRAAETGNAQIGIASGQVLEGMLAPLLGRRSTALAWARLGAKVALAELSLPKTPETDALLDLWGQICRSVGRAPEWLQKKVKQLTKRRKRLGWLADHVRDVVIPAWEYSPDGPYKVAGAQMRQSRYRVLVALRLENGNPLSLKELRARSGVDGAQNDLTWIRQHPNLKTLVSPRRPIRWLDLTFPPPPGSAVPPDMQHNPE